MEKNTPELWDRIWREHGAGALGRDALAREERSLRWRRLERAIAGHFYAGGASLPIGIQNKRATRESGVPGIVPGLRVIEIGAGVGTCSALLARRGAQVTILDYSAGALARSREFYAGEGLKAEFIEQNALDLPASLIGKFDLAMSFGLTEHFTGEVRKAINKAHFDLVRPGGMAIISVPNALNPPYRMYKWMTELTGKWMFGEEYPYTRMELARLCRELGVQDYRFVGNSFLGSFHYVNPLRVSGKLRRVLGIGELKPPDCEIASPLDSWLADALVLIAVKPG
ncbi:MAG: class I SAM-dependent methyltransferase [Candidatus Sumerlaeia bacterium]